MVFTIRRDLTSIAALHAEINALLRQEIERGREIDPPAFPDPFHIGTMYAGEGSAQLDSFI